MPVVEKFPITLNNLVAPDFLEKRRRSKPNLDLSTLPEALQQPKLSLHQKKLLMPLGPHILAMSDDASKTQMKFQPSIEVGSKLANWAVISEQSLDERIRMPKLLKVKIKKKKSESLGATKEFKSVTANQIKHTLGIDMSTHPLNKKLMRPRSLTKPTDAF